jgi:hypothetical protein
MHYGHIHNQGTQIYVERKQDIRSQYGTKPLLILSIVVNGYLN